MTAQSAQSQNHHGLVWTQHTWARHGSNGWSPQLLLCWVPKACPDHPLGIWWEGSHAGQTHLNRAENQQRVDTGTSVTVCFTSTQSSQTPAESAYINHILITLCKVKKKLWKAEIPGNQTAPEPSTWSEGSSGEEPRSCTGVWMPAKFGAKLGFLLETRPTRPDFPAVPVLWAAEKPAQHIPQTANNSQPEGGGDKPRRSCGPCQGLGVSGYKAPVCQASVPAWRLMFNSSSAEVLLHLQASVSGLNHNLLLQGTDNTHRSCSPPVTASWGGSGRFFPPSSNRAPLSG